jgi:hypothetical protein
MNSIRARNLFKSSGKKRLKAVSEVPLPFRPRFSSPYRGLLIETLHYQIKLENSEYKKEEVKKELFLLTTSLNFCGLKKIIEDHRL